MGEQKNRDIRLKLSPREAAAYLHRLAADLMHGRVEVGSRESALAGEVDLRQSHSFNSDGTSVEVKIRFKTTGPWLGPDTVLSSVASGGPVGGEADEAPPVPELKREMQRLYKDIRSSLEFGNLPSPESVASFCEKAESMTSPPMGGADNFPEFLEQVDLLAEASRAGDMSALESALGELGRMMKECHAKFKQ